MVRDHVHGRAGGQDALASEAGARASCTLYEIRYAMEEVFGSYKEPVFF